MPSALEALLSELRRSLEASGYGVDSLGRLLGISNLDDVGVLNHPVAIERVRDDASPAAVLTRLLFLEQGESRRAVERVLGRKLVEQSRELGLLRSTKQSELQSQLRIDPVGSQYFLADLRFRRARSNALRLPRGDDVYPASSDSVLLSGVVKVDAGADVLDLCTGSGIQGLQAAATAATVTAVDINPRAAAMARCNAQLNQVGHFEPRCADLYSGLGKRRFGVILANPPFVSSPYSDAPSYHAGGARGDRVLRRILAGLRTRLSPGGHAFAVTHVGLRHEDELEEIARGWFRSFQGRAAVLTLERGSDLDLAAGQGLFALRHGTASYAREIRHWLAYLRLHRIRHIALVLIVAHNDGGKTVEVIDARPKILPLPLTPGPQERVAKWLGACA